MAGSGGAGGTAGDGGAGGGVVPLCADVNCDSGNSCIDGGECNPATGVCEGGGNAVVDSPCDGDGFCDGAGRCVDCNSSTQCPSDGNECTLAECANATCTQTNAPLGVTCDLSGIDDGRCEAGVCVVVPACAIDDDCDDLNVCTINTCDGVACAFASNTGAPCAEGDDPGTCQEDGTCFVDRCVDVLCEDSNQCTDDGTCNPATGLCEGAGSSPAGTTCDQNDGLVCDGAGSCVECVVMGPLRRQEAYVKASNTGRDDAFGSSTAIDGDFMVIGAPGEDSASTPEDNDLAGSGAAYVFKRTGCEWEQTAFLKGTDTGVNTFFGASVAIDGDIVVVGAPRDNAGELDSGAAFIFERNGEDWALVEELQPPLPSGQLDFGSSVDVDGDRVIVGAPGQFNGTPTEGGTVYVYDRVGDEWPETTPLKAPNFDGGHGFGNDVGVSGGTIVVGAPGEDSAVGTIQTPNNTDAPQSGAAYVFVLDDGAWGFEAYLKATNIDASAGFGRSVAIDGSTVVVSASREDAAVADSGAVYVFEGPTFSSPVRIAAAEPGLGDLFGASTESYTVGVSTNGGVAVDGDRILVGAIREDSDAVGIDGDAGNDLSPQTGAAYVFERGDGSWAQSTYLKSSNPEFQDHFGRGVAISGELLVVGAYGEDSAATGVNGDQVTDDTAGRNSGAAYVFVLP